MTMIAAPVKRGGLLAPLPPSDGTSSAAAAVREVMQEALSALARSIAVRKTAEAAIAELGSLQRVAAERNWDGYGALPLDPRAAEHALTFLQALPTTVPAPDVSVDPDGEVDLLWQRDPTTTISVSIGPNGRLTYAALVGTAQSCGTEWLAGEIPQPILDSLARVLDRMK
jgi:hypothetical protein